MDTPSRISNFKNSFIVFKETQLTIFLSIISCSNQRSAEQPV